MASHISGPNNTKYLVNPSTLSNLIRNGSDESNFCMECDNPRYFCIIFHLLKYQNQNL